MSLMNREDLINRGVEEIIIKEDFLEKLDSGQSLRLKMGFDPSAPDIHLGHVVGLRKLRQLQELGHKVILIIGDWTAQIGDPSGRSQTRKMLSAEEVNANAQTYLDQFFKIVDQDQTEIRLQSEWFGPFNLSDVIELTSKFTVAQILARDDFANRFSDNHPIAITELLYPLLQAYDSVAIQSDVEFGGSDQRFNLLVGRELQQSQGMEPQQCFIMPLLPGTDGTQKMSKSLGNYIGINETGREIYGKIMSIPDTLIARYYEWLTDTPTPQVLEIQYAVSEGTADPMALKKEVAHIIVCEFHTLEVAQEAESFFTKTVQNREVPEYIDQFILPVGTDGETLRLSNILVEAGLTSSSGEARRLIDQNAIKLDGTTLTKNLTSNELGRGILKVGRRRYIRLI